MPAIPNIGGYAAQNQYFYDKGNKEAYDLFNNAGAGKAFPFLDVGSRGLTNFLAGSGAGPAWSRNQWGLPLANQGYSTLAEILSGRGALDPRFKNQAVAGAERAGQGVQQGIQAGMAQRGLGNSGIGMALQSAAANSTAARRSGMEAQFAQQQDQQKRADLQSLLDMLLGPAQDDAALALGQYAGQQQRKDSKSGALLGALGTIFGGIAGGPAGAAIGGSLGGAAGGR